MSSVYSGFPDEFGILAYPEKNPSTIQFLQTRFTEAAASAGQLLTDYGRAFYERAQAVVEQATGSDAMMFSKAVLRKAGKMFQRNEIRSLWSIDQIQTAPQAMHRYIMAHPALRTLYHDQRASGFEDADVPYVDMEPNAVGPEHYEYRRVMDGAVRDDEEHDYRISFYLDDIRPGDRELHPDEKFDMRTVFDLISEELQRSGARDPSSVTDNKL